jgi:2-iminobutanoate/2-iminopropanoate deaminase
MKEFITTNDAPAAIGPYSQAVKVDLPGGGSMLFCSGQIPLDPADGKIVGAGAAEQAEQCLKNLQAVLLAGGAELKDVVKVNVYLTSMSDFQAVNEAYARYFTTALPARAAVEVSRLPKDVRVEIEATAVF